MIVFVQEVSMDVDDGCDTFQDSNAKEAVAKAIAETMGIPHVYVVFLGCTETSSNLRSKELQAATSVNVCVFV